MLAEIGYAGALLARELNDGALELIDGHLRAETTPDSVVPVLVLDLSAAEADKLLATFDLLTGMAGADLDAVQALVSEVQTQSDAVRELLDRNVAKAKADSRFENPINQPPPEINLPTLFQIVVECNGEKQQRELYEQLTSEGYQCRVMTL